MPPVVQMDVKITVPVSVEPAGDMPDKWAEGLTGNAQRIIDRLTEVLPDEGSFQNRLAEPSHRKFAGTIPVINPAFESQAGRDADNINRAHYKNLAGAYDHFVAKEALMFETVEGIVAKRFKEQVNGSKDNWATAVAEKTLRATGDKIRGTILGQSLFWMTGDLLANQMTNHMVIIAGAPYDFTEAGLRQVFRAAGMPKLVQAAIQIINANFLAAEIAAQNTILTALGNAFAAAAIAPFVTPATATDSAFEFVVIDSALILLARIVTT